MHPTLRKSAPALSLVLYLTLSLLFFGATRGFTTHVLGVGGDSWTSVWCLQWWPWAITHGLNPFVSQKVWYPVGVDVTWVTSIPALSLIGLPLTLLGSAIVTFNTLSLLAPALAAWSAFLLARYLTRDTASALIAGFLYGFSSYQLGHGLGHLNLSMTCLVPIVLLICLKRLKDEISRRRCVALLTATLLVQFGISIEIFGTACLFGALSWLVFLPLVTAETRGRLQSLALEFMAALAIVAVLTSPFLFFLIRGMRNLPPTLNPPEMVSADPLNFLVPTVLTRFGNAYFAAVANRFTGGVPEQTAYLGLPVILILAAFFARRLPDPIARGLLSVLLLLILCSLGPRLWMNGTQTGLWLPWAWIDKVPLIRSALPGRFTLYVFLLAGLIVALWVAEPASRRTRGLRLLLAAGACLFLLPNRTLTGIWTSAELLPFFDQARNGVGLKRDQNALLLPFGPFGPNMIWQWQARYSFTQSAGYTGLIPPVEAALKVIQLLNSGQNPPGLGRMILEYCRTHRVTAIVAGPNTAPALIAELQTMGWPSTQQGGVLMFSDPTPSLAETASSRQ
jgi:hypothetical protein